MNQAIAHWSDRYSLECRDLYILELDPRNGRHSSFAWMYPLERRTCSVILPTRW